MPTGGYVSDRRTYQNGEMYIGTYIMFVWIIIKI